MDPDIERKFNDLISILKSIEGKVGLPPASADDENLVITPVDSAKETETAKIWYRAFEDSPSFGFMKPLTTFLTGAFQDSLFQTFQRVFAGGTAAGFTPSPIPGMPLADFLELEVDAISGVSEALVDLGQSIATAAVGFLLFSLVSWDGVAKGVAAMTLLVMSLGFASAVLPETEGIGEIIESISYSLAAAAVGFMLFSLVPFEGIGKGLLFISGVIFLLNGLAPAAENSVETAELITAIGQTLLVSSVSFLLFNFVNWDSVFKGITVLASIVLAVAGISNVTDDALSGAEAVEAVGRTLLMSAASFLIFSFVNWNKAMDGITVLTSIIIGVAFLSTLDSDVRKGAEAVQFVGVGLLASSLAFLLFSFVDWSAITKGFGALLGLVGIVSLIGKIKGQLIEGALAIGILSLALLPLSIAMLLFDTIDTSAVGVMAASLTTLGLAAYVIGLPAVAPFIAIGAGVLLLLGASLLVFGLAMRSFTSDESVWEKLPIAGENIALFLGQLSLSYFSILTAAAAAPFLLVIGLALTPLTNALSDLVNKGIDWTKLQMVGEGINVFLLALGANPLAALSASAISVFIRMVGYNLKEVIPALLELSKTELNLTNVYNFGIGINTLLTGIGDSLFAAIKASVASVFVKSAVTDIVGIVQSLAAISDIDTARIPGKGADIASFLNRFVSELKISTIFFLGVLSLTLPAFAAGILSIANGLTTLKALDTSAYGAIGEGIADFFNNLGDIDSDSLEPIREIGEVLPVIDKMISTLSIMSGPGLSKLGDLNFAPLVSSAAAFAAALKPVADTIRDINSAIGDFSFIKLSALVMGLSNLTVSVSQASNDMSKTNEILQQSLSVQRLQLEELKAQTSMLANLKPQAPIIPQQNNAAGARGSNTIISPRQNFESSPYFVKPVR